jgi:hypothetical protein
MSRQFQYDVYLLLSRRGSVAPGSLRPPSSPRWAEERPPPGRGSVAGPGAAQAGTPRSASQSRTAPGGSPAHSARAASRRSSAERPRSSSRR